MRVFIVGGTGFIGHHSTIELVKRGHHVTVFGLPPAPKDNQFPEEVEILTGDLHRLTDDELRRMLIGMDVLIFAAGADDRVVPKKPAREFYLNANVKSVVRCFRLARDAGVKRGIIIGSYFAHFDRIWPHLRLSANHPYIHSRQTQWKEAFKTATSDFAPMLIELPYVFGISPGKEPLWKPLLSYVCSRIPLFYTKGGTNVISVGRVAEAVAGAAEKGTALSRYLVGDENVTWRELLERISRLCGRNQRMITLPTSSVRVVIFLVAVFYKVQGREPGLNPVKFVDLQTSETYFDPSSSREALGYEGGGVDDEIRSMVERCCS